MNPSTAHKTVVTVEPIENEDGNLVVVHSPLHAVTISITPSFPLQKPGWRILKRAVDFALSCFLLIFLFSWICPVIALLIRLDSPGPVFFIQKRNKRNRKIFYCIKFRTMYVNGDADHQPSVENDPRITKIGKFLRYSHLDELPQLLNVFIGDMSMIGPRPYMISDNCRYEYAVPFYAMRHHVKPGITGHAQVLGFVGRIEGVQHMKERLKKDIYYIENWSPAFDARILWRTFLLMFRVGK